MLSFAIAARSPASKCNRSGFTPRQAGFYSPVQFHEKMTDRNAFLRAKDLRHGYLKATPFLYIMLVYSWLH